MKLAQTNNEASKLLSEFQKIYMTLDNAELVCTKIDGTKYNFNIFALPLNVIEKLHNYKITQDEGIKDQEKLETLLSRPENYNAKNKKKLDKKNEVLKSAAILFHARKNIADLFRKGIFSR